MPSTMNKQKIKRLSKSDWLRQGLESLRLYGIKGLNIDSLSEYIGVTKGSFYWHFKDSKEFRHELIRYWEQEKTTLPIEKIRALSDNPSTRMRALIEVIFNEELGKYDPDMRVLAGIEEKAEKAIERIDKHRIMYTRSLFEEMGFSKKEAAVRARIFYLHCIGEFAVFKNKKERSKYISEKHKFFTSK